MRGLGAYPDDPYYDPNRPSWLPYWIDTPTESLAKYNSENMIQATATAGGQAIGSIFSDIVGGVGQGIGGSLSFGAIIVIGVVAYMALKK